MQHAARMRKRGGGGVLENARQPATGAIPRRVFVGRDLVFVGQRQADVVQTVQQAMFAERIDVELEFQARGVGHRLRLQIDRQVVLARGGTAEQFVDVRFG